MGLLATATTVLSVAAAGTASEEPAHSAANPAATAGSPATSSAAVTLITGDQVQVDAAGKVLGVRPAKGREHIKFSVVDKEDKTLVIPADAQAAFAEGALDERLFDVALLRRHNYDDDARAELPIIVTGSGDDTSAYSAARDAAGATVNTTLASIQAATVDVDRSAGSAFWDSVTTASEGPVAANRGLKPGIGAIWLDGPVQTSLDSSVAQIGAPAAWDAGLDGDGVTVAVLDTGIDESHPDLADRVVAANNFSEADDHQDRVGHGTHVASTIAGSGAASDGRYRGTAPGARLLNGKVLDDEGWGFDSDIIAGMEWAVDKGAQIVNLSLGGSDYPKRDPLEQAIEALTAEHGTLFVVAAGNDGSFTNTVDSPASSPSALAVGAVDAEDVVADFSGRGPAADGALKPDITAPGVDIKAARATATGTAPYTTFSGTSMAAPHVAGAAAILAQRHPDADAAELKALLTASANPTPELTSFAQGAGRVDVARAVEQSVTTSPAAVDFGLAKAPHEDEPRTQKLTYHNPGDEPVELDLAVETYGPEDAEWTEDTYDPFSAPSPAGMFSVEPGTLTIPAGGEASATVTADTSVDAEYGHYGGTVTASNPDTDTTVRTAVGIHRQEPFHKLTLTLLGEDGEPAADASASVIGYDTDTFELVEPDANGVVTMEVPEDTHQVTATFAKDEERVVEVAYPKLTVTDNTEVTFDERDAEPFDLSVPDPDATPQLAFYSYGAIHDGIYLGAFFVGWRHDQFEYAQIGPELAEGEADSMLSVGWNAAKDDGPPHWYHTAWHSDRSLLAGHSAAPGPDEFATIDTRLGRSEPDKTIMFSAAAVDVEGYFWQYPTDTAVGDAAVNHVLGNDITWSFAVNQEPANPEHSDKRWSFARSEPRTYEAGETYTETYNVGVFGPTLAAGLDGETGAIRIGERFWARIPMFGDGIGRSGYSDYSDAVSTLRFNGEEILSIDRPFTDVLRDTYDFHEVPSGAGRFELTTDVSRPEDTSLVSNRVQATWSFDAEAASDDEVQEFPLSTIRYSPKLSLGSTARAGRIMRIPFTVEGAAEDGVRDLSIYVSYNEGKTWKPVRQLPGHQFLVKHPKEPGSVSFRAHLTDTDGNTLDQTIYRAYLTE